MSFSTKTELDKYKHKLTADTGFEYGLVSSEPFPIHLGFKIIGCFEENTHHVGMQFIESALGDNKRPTVPLLLSMVNFIMKSKCKLHSKDDIVKQWLLCKKAHTILLDTLTLFGPNIYDPLWNQFRNFELIETKRAAKECQDDDYDLLNTSELTTFRDLWNFIERLLSNDSKGVDAKCYGLILDFFVKLLQTDLKSRLDDKKQVQVSIFVKTLNGRGKHFKKYLAILLDKFPNQGIHLTGLIGDLLNMLITVAYFDCVGTQDDLATQMHSFIQTMDAESYETLLGLIEFPSFVILLCDITLANVDTSQVSKVHKCFKNRVPVSLQPQKMVCYVLKTLPQDKTSIENVYRHVLIVSKYCMCVSSMTTFAQKELVGLHKAFDEFKTMIQQLIDKEEQDVDRINKINWSIQFAMLYFS